MGKQGCQVLLYSKCLHGSGWRACKRILLERLGNKKTAMELVIPILVEVIF